MVLEFRQKLVAAYQETLKDKLPATKQKVIEDMKQTYAKRKSPQSFKLV